MILTTPFYIDGLTADAYHAAPGWSSSQIRRLPDNPLKFRNRYLCRRPDCLKPLDECVCALGPKVDYKPPTAAMEQGTTVHRVLLDDCSIKVIPSDLLTPKGKRPTGKSELPLLEWEADNCDSVHAMKDDSPLHRMVEMVRTHPIAGPMIADPEAIKERSIWWVDDETGLLCKARIDWWRPVSMAGHLLDLKTTKAPRPGKRDFGAEIAAYELHRQLAWYTEGALQVGMKPWGVGFITVGNSGEHECWDHGTMPDEALDLGYSQNIAARREIAARLDSGNWYPDGYADSHETGPSDWYMRQHE
jgi:hypothetical protein